MEREEEYWRFPILGNKKNLTKIAELSIIKNITAIKE